MKCFKTLVMRHIKLAKLIFSSITAASRMTRIYLKRERLRDPKIPEKLLIMLDVVYGKKFKPTATYYPLKKI